MVARHGETPITIQRSRATVVHDCYIPIRVGIGPALTLAQVAQLFPSLHLPLLRVLHLPLRGLHPHPPRRVRALPRVHFHPVMLDGALALLLPVGERGPFTQLDMVDEPARSGQREEALHVPAAAALLSGEGEKI